MIRKVVKPFSRPSHQKGDCYFRDLRWRPGSKHFLMIQNYVLFFGCNNSSRLFFHVSNVTFVFPKNFSSAEGFGETHCPIQRLHRLCEQVPYLASTDEYMLPTPCFLLADVLFEFRKDSGNTGRANFSFAHNPAEKEGTTW